MIDVDETGLRSGLDAASMPTGEHSVAAFVKTLPYSDAPALIDRNGTLTYARLVEATRAAVLGLRALGVGPGAVVAASAPNVNELIVAFLAVQCLGGIWVGINRVLAPAEKLAQLRDCGATLFLGDDESLRQIDGVRHGLPALGRLVSLQGEIGQFMLAGSGKAGVAIEISLPDPFAPAAIAYTSGTTGVPKGAVHNQHGMMVFVNGRYDSPDGGQWIRGYRRGMSIPLTILNCMLFGPVATLAGGGCFVAMDRSDAEGVGHWIQSQRVEVFNGAPPTFRDLLFKSELQHIDLSSLKAVALGGAAIPDNVSAAFREKFGFEIITDYGLTESPASVASSLIGERLPSSSPGRPNHHLEVAIMGPAGERLATDEVGELCVGPTSQGPWAGVYTGMLGYWRKPDETRAAFHGRWLRTGDLASVDANGFVRIAGRQKEMILRGGANIYPIEVEAVLRLHASVEDVVVLGLPDERLGEIVVAYLQLRPGKAADAALRDELRSFCAERLARYKLPERWFVLDSFPRNAMNKPIRKQFPTLACVELGTGDMPGAERVPSPARSST